MNFSSIVSFVCMALIFIIQIIRLAKGEFSWDILLIILLTINCLIYKLRDALVSGGAE